MSEKTDLETMLAQSAELLRIILPVMSKHKIPVTPSNYAVWYAYYSHTTPELNALIDRVLQEDQPFTQELNERLFNDFIADCNINQFNKVRGEMSHLMNEVSGTLNEVGNEAASYHGTLHGLVNNIEGNLNLESLREVLFSLVEETRSMQRSTQLLHEHLESKSHEITLLQEELEIERERAARDPLTGLANRKAFFETLNQLIKELGSSQALSVLMLDIDHFKRINDTHGHLIGDRVIRHTAQILQNHTKGRDLPARYGGEEFAVVLPDTGLEGARIVAERIRVSLADSKLIRSDNKQPIGQVTISIGVAQYRRGEDSTDVINRADQALYYSKHNGRNKVSLGHQLNGKQSA